jgi:hypothetical protein
MALTRGRRRSKNGPRDGVPPVAHPIGGVGAEGGLPAIAPARRANENKLY